MITQDTVVLNNPSDWAGLARRERTTSTGTHVRYSINVTSEAIVHDFGELRKAAATAQAILGVLQRGIKAITVPASPATLAKRALAAAGLARGDPSYVARYTGGRTGASTPNQSDRLFNDSGRLADGLFVRRNAEEEGFTINVPANRLDPRTFGGGEAAIIAMWQRLVELVPAFKGGPVLFNDPDVRRALLEDVDAAIFVATERGKAALARGRSQLAMAILRDVGRVLTIGG